VAAYLSSVEWFALTVFLFGVGIFVPPLRIIPYLMFGGTLCVALSYMVRARIEPRFDTVHARLLVMVLAFVQPLARGWSRYFTWLHFKRTPRAVITRHEMLPAGAERTRGAQRRTYWSENGKDRHHLLTTIFQLLEEEGWRYSTDSGWNNWDVQIYGNLWWSVTLQTVTEYHGGPKCLTRLRLRSRMVPTTAITNMVALSVLIYRQLSGLHLDWSVFIPYALFLVFLALRARALKRRVAELVDLAAYRAGLQWVSKKKQPVQAETPPPPVDAEKELDVAAK
jgi:hypothetical protein